MSDSLTLLIDSHCLGYQALYSKTYKEMNMEGNSTGVIVGMLDHILELGEKFRTNDLEFCWDSKRNLRKERFDFYKANRKTEDPEKLKLRADAQVQFKLLREKILPQIGFVNQHMQDGFEADDVMAKIIQDSVGKFVMVTSDEDLFQMLYGAKHYSPSANKLTTSTTLVRDYGISYDKWCMVKQIGGCRTDHVPGAPGVGETTAIQFLNKQLKPDSVKYKSILASEDIIDINYWLVHLPMNGCKMPERKVNTPNFTGFRNVCLEYGLDSILAQRSRWQNFLNGTFADED